MRPFHLFLRLSVPCGLLGLLLFQLGCGKKNTGRSTGATVTGKVTFDKKPLIGGIVVMVNDSEDSASGAISPSGEYTIKEAPLGQVKVYLSLPSEPQQQAHLPEGTPDPMKDLTPEMKAKMKDQAVPELSSMKDVKPIPAEDREKYEALRKMVEGMPAKYTKKDATPLTFTVEKGESTFPIDIPKP